MKCCRVIPGPQWMQSNVSNDPLHLSLVLILGRITSAADWHKMFHVYIYGSQDNASHVIR